MAYQYIEQGVDHKMLESTPGLIVGRNLQDCIQDWWSIASLGSNANISKVVCFN